MDFIPEDGRKTDRPKRFANNIIYEINELNIQKK